MGYTTQFEGKIKLDKKLDEKSYLEFINRYEYGAHFSIERIGFYKDMPREYLQWHIKSDKQHLSWDGGEKFYGWLEWMKWLSVNFFAARGYTLNGTIKWQGEERDDNGLLIVKNNIVTTKSLNEIIRAAGYELYL